MSARCEGRLDPEGEPGRKRREGGQPNDGKGSEAAIKGGPPRRHAFLESERFDHSRISDSGRARLLISNAG